MLTFFVQDIILRSRISVKARARTELAAPVPVITRMPPLQVCSSGWGPARRQISGRGRKAVPHTKPPGQTAGRRIGVLARGRTASRGVESLELEQRLELEARARCWRPQAQQLS